MKQAWKHVRRAKKLSRQLADCRGALASQATTDSEARRRHTDTDSDSWMYSHISPYRLDRNKARRCKMMRRLGNKTQVITAPLNSHARDREDHSMEAAAVAVDIASILGANVDLVETGLLLHDNGHMPCGHAAEDFLSDRTGKKWRHPLLGVVIAQHVERRGQGLNLTWQVLDIILNHSRGASPAVVQGMKPEPAIAVKADKIAYTFSDIGDIFGRQALAAQGFTPFYYPEIMEAVKWFGSCQREREFTCIANLCIESAEKGYVSFDECEAAVRFEELKRLMYELVYTSIDRSIINLKMSVVYEALAWALRVIQIDPALVFALMDDRELDWLYQKVSQHEIIDLNTLKLISVGEIIPHIRDRLIDVTDPDLAW
ncbi:MAG: HD domain-containing protein [Patescibacteria group bacterium]